MMVSKSPLSKRTNNALFECTQTVVKTSEPESQPTKKRLRVEIGSVFVDDILSRRASPGKTSSNKIPKMEVNNTIEKKQKPKETINSPQAHLLSILNEGGYKAETINAMQLKGFFLEVTEERINAYDQDVIAAVRTENLNLLREMHKNGRNMQCSNRFGESLLHLACRRGLTAIVEFLLVEANVSLRVRDDFGRTPLHDACWTPSPNFPLIELLMKHDSDLLLIHDVRGHTPFSYVRKNHWEQWLQFLDEKRGLIQLKTFGTRNITVT